MLASLLWAVGPVHFDEAKVPKQVHMWYDKPNGFFTTTDYFNTCAALRNSPDLQLRDVPPRPSSSQSRQCERERSREPPATFRMR